MYVVTLLLPLFTYLSASYAHVAGASTLNHVFSDNSFAMERLSGQDSVQKAFFLERIVPSQFVLIGEQHGIKEVGEFTDYIFQIAHRVGYDYLCIETDSLVASYLERFSRAPSLAATIEQAQALHAKFPFAIPFYDNYNDYELFRNVFGIDENTDSPRIWGIDAAYFLEFGFAFSHLCDTAADSQVKAQLRKLVEQSEAGFNEAITTGNLKALSFYQFDEHAYQTLLDLATGKQEEQLLQHLWRSKMYNQTLFGGAGYKSVYLRANIMKDSFTSYYRQVRRSGILPKVVFKMGADHLGRGRNGSGVYDIGNFATELARYNKRNSFHIQVKGLNGYENHHGPFTPSAKRAFNNLDDLPQEIQSFVTTNPTVAKYLVIDLVPFRFLNRSFSVAFRELIFRYDVIVLVSKCEAIEEFGQN